MRSMKSLLFALLMPLGALAYVDLKSPPMSNVRLQDQVTKLKPGLKNLNDLPAILPEEFRLNFILKHGIKRVGPRGHLVETRVSQSADPNLPRAILWDERNGYTVSYNGAGPGQLAGQRLDILRFHASTKKFHLEQVDFPLQRPGKLVFGTSDCLTCHGPQGRPIFSMYPDWPAFYGSDNDELLAENEAQRAELADYTAFMGDAALTHPRYRPLFQEDMLKRRLGIELYPTYPYRYELAVDQDDPSRAFSFRPGLRLGLLYNRQMAQHLSARLQVHKNFPKLGKFFLYNLLQCAPVSTDTNKTLVQYQRALAEAKKLTGATPASRTSTLMDYRAMWGLMGMKLNDVDIRFSYNHSGYDNTDASKDVMAVGYIGNYFNAYFDGSATIDELVAGQLYEYYAARHPGLKDLVTLRGLTAKYGRFSQRMAFDGEFFKEMDKSSRWIPTPYPSQLAEVHHREVFQRRFGEEHGKLCQALEGMLWWPTKP
jgi:hypothetical protein